MDKSKEEIEIRVDPSVTPSPFDIFDLSFFKKKKRNEGYQQNKGKEKENEEDEDEEFEWEQATLQNEVGGHLVLELWRIPFYSKTYRFLLGGIRCDCVRRCLQLTLQRRTEFNCCWWGKLNMAASATRNAASTRISMGYGWVPYTTHYLSACKTCMFEWDILSNLHLVAANN